MRNIYINMHRRDKISVALSAGTGGTAVFTQSALGPVYSLSSLPMGTQIQLVQIQGVDTYVFLHNNNEIGTLTITPSSGYNFDSVMVNNSIVTSTPITLNNGDVIEAIFKMTDYLCFTANTAGSTVQLTKYGTPTKVTLETSADKINWTTYTIGDTITLTNVGDSVYWRNTSTIDTWFGTDSENYYQFVMTGSIAGSGDTNFLLNKNSTTTLSASCFKSLFYNCTSLTTAPALPATTLDNYCYRTMFDGCTGLTTAPALPATTLKEGCYYLMFDGCTGLTTAPALPATTLASDCYAGMFGGCTSLIAPPELPATTLATGCYYGMFQLCTSLTKLPALPATTLAIYCYNSMFNGCSKIKLSTSQTGDYQTAYRIPIIGYGTSGSFSLDDMFAHTGGTFASTPSINTTYYTSNTVVS